MEKTAMMQLKEKLKKTHDSIEHMDTNGDIGKYYRGYRAAIKQVIKDIDSQMLAIEKELRKKDYENGKRDGVKQY